MNQELKPGTLLVLGLALFYFGGVSTGALGVGLSVGGLCCFVAAIIGFFKRPAKVKEEVSESVVIYDKEVEEEVEYEEAEVDLSAPSSEDDVNIWPAVVIMLLLFFILAAMYAAVK